MMDIPKRTELVKEPTNYVNEERLSDRYQLLKNEVDRRTKGPTLLMWVSPMSGGGKNAFLRQQGKVPLWGRKSRHILTRSNKGG